MSDMSIFYSSMSNVLNQWSDFRVSKNLYKYYFAQQKAEKTSAAQEAASKYESKKTEKTTSSAYSAAKNDKLKTYANNVSSAVTKLESAFKEDKDTGMVDMDKAYDAASSFVNSYNDLYSSIRSSGNSTVSGKSEFMANMTSAYGSRLAKVGITAGSDGKLSIDKDKFNSASEDELADVFGKDKKSFASFAASQSKALSAYADTAAYLDTNNTYTKSGQVASSNASALSGVLYNQLF